MTQVSAHRERLLSPGDGAPFEIVNAQCTGPLVLICEHAGRAIPHGLSDLGLTSDDLDRHVAYDIGAENVARALADHLQAPLVLQPYSRLVIDCNRPLAAADCIPEISDGTRVPGNRALTPNARRQRYDEIHQPFHAKVSELLDARPGAGLVSIHSFTPRLRSDGIERPWEIGYLFDKDERLAKRLMDASKRIRPGLVAAFNQPYVVNETGDYAMPIHGEARGIPHVLIELRNDLIADADGQREWADFLAQAITDALQDRNGMT